MEKRSWTTPRGDDLGLHRIKTDAGLWIDILPNGCLFSIEHRRPHGAIIINQLLGSPAGRGMAQVYLRVDKEAPLPIQAAGPTAKARCGAAENGFVWEGESGGIRYRLTLLLHAREAAWLWHIEALNMSACARSLDAVLVQDIGLGERGFLMNNEAFASQYIDHHIARHRQYGPVIMSRQNLMQAGSNPWAAHGCLDGAVSYATDGLQLFGPAFRDSDAFVFPYGTPLPGARLQHELACAALQSAPATLQPGGRAVWRFFGVFEADHPGASADGDLARIESIHWDIPHAPATDLAPAARSLLQDAPAAVAASLSAHDMARLYPERLHEEWRDGELLSFFAPDPPLNRHIVLRNKERLVTRRHGTLLRSGQSMLPDEATLCSTCWMHGVFAAQLTIGNTAFHKLFPVSREPYNITRSSGLRILIDMAGGWQLLTVPSAFEMGLSDCRWIYLLPERMVTVQAIADGAEAAMAWRITVDGEPCRFLIFSQIVLGEREFDSPGRIECGRFSKRFTLRPDPDSIWSQHFPDAVYHLVTGTGDAVEAIGDGELIGISGPSAQGFVALRTRPVQDFAFAAVGSMTDPDAAERLAREFERDPSAQTLLAPAVHFWSGLTRSLRFMGGGDEGSALDTLFPWLVHNAMIHLTVPHGLEQYTGAAWGTRDVCQGPVELLLALGHDEAVKAILRIVFAQQYEDSGDWPQWFMLEPYSVIQDRVSHGDVIVWPLKALNDYIEATGDFGFLDEQIAWRRSDTFEKTARAVPVKEHAEKLLAAVQARFIEGTHLIRYGEGDWNDSLQPADPKLRDIMVSSWTVALLYQQINRYAEVLRCAGSTGRAEDLRGLAIAMRGDFNRYLLRDGTVAGYAIFEPGGGEPELLLHPSDTRTGLSYSLLPMTRSIISGLFTQEQIEHHLKLIRVHLLFPDGVRLIDRPVAYHGGPQTTFRRAESASFFGREIGLMYTHAHLRYAEAMAVLGDAEALWDALQLASPISVTDRLANALPRQRNAYFSSSDAAFPDRYAASEEWQKVGAATIGVDGGWRIYSSGPGIFVNLVIGSLFGRRRLWGKPLEQPLLPAAQQAMAMEAQLFDEI